MATFSVRNTSGFNMNNAFALSNPTTILKNSTAWVIKNSVTGAHHNWYGTGFTYDANNQISGGLATKLVMYDALNAVQAVVNFPTAWDFATKGAPADYAALLAGNDVLTGGAGNDVLLGFAGNDTLGGGGGASVNGGVIYNGHTYLLSNAGSWTNAQAQAQSLGGNLVTINNQAEQDWIYARFGRTTNIWIGYTDQEIEGNWKWISGESASYTNWNPGQPDNNGGSPGVSQNYGFLWATFGTGQWADLQNYVSGSEYGSMRGIIEINTLKTGNDTLKGGLGNDTYLVDSIGDVVVENASQGIDTVKSSITYTLPANLENLILTSTEKLTGIGNGLNNIITGNSAANTLLGGSGNDTLNGGAGNDFLATGLGNDSVQGGDGIDTAIYSGNFSGYSLQYLNNTLRITDTDSTNGGYGMDTLTGIEALQFADKTLYTNTIDIFKSQLTATEREVAGSENGGMVRVMADFSKAAYDLQSWEQSTAYNDTSNGSHTAYQGVLSQGWQPLDLPVGLTSGSFDIITEHRALISTKASFFADNQMTGGYYTNQNAAAFVARCGDSIILSFRGTNDNNQPNADSGVINPNDTANNIRPDVDQWGQANDGSNQSMTNHYALFNNLITAFDTYVSTASNGINHVYVTGHSLGGAMALEYMSLHAGNQYQAVTFAAPAFTNADISRQNFSADSRVIQIEVAKDPVPMTWDIKNLLGNTSNRQGEVIRFSGDNTLATPDDHTAIFGTVGFKANDNNHSMDYYRTITDNVDAVTWQNLLGLTGTQEVFLGGNRTVTNRIENFTVATNNDILAPTDKNYTAIYGGLGADIITGGAANELIIGGQGKDSLTGGLGMDTFSLYSAIESGLTDTTRDLIQDFTHAESDRINLASIDANTMMDGNNVFAFINSNAFSAPGQIRFANGILAANTDADLQTEFQIALTGVTSLTATDIIL